MTQCVALDENGKRCRGKAVQWTNYHGTWREEMSRHVWVVEVRWSADETWRPARTISLRPALYLTRSEARRDLYNRQIARAHGSKFCRIVRYEPRRAGQQREG